MPKTAVAFSGEGNDLLRHPSIIQEFEANLQYRQFSDAPLSDGQAFAESYWRSAAPLPPPLLVVRAVPPHADGRLSSAGTGSGDAVMRSRVDRGFDRGWHGPHSMDGALAGVVPGTSRAAMAAEPKNTAKRKGVINLRCCRSDY